MRNKRYPALVTDAAMARSMWTLFEPVHAVTYFAAEARSAYEQAGLRGFWRGYFAGRAPPGGGRRLVLQLRARLRGPRHPRRLGADHAGGGAAGPAGRRGRGP